MIHEAGSGLRIFSRSERCRVGFPHSVVDGYRLAGTRINKGPPAQNSDIHSAWYPRMNTSSSEMKNLRRIDNLGPPSSSGDIIDAVLRSWYRGEWG